MLLKPGACHIDSSPAAKLQDQFLDYGAEIFVSICYFTVAIPNFGGIQHRPSALHLVNEID